MTSTAAKLVSFRRMNRSLCVMVALFEIGCTGQGSAAGHADAGATIGSPDAGPSDDGGRDDGGLQPDAGLLDAGSVSFDAGVMDAGPSDGGVTCGNGQVDPGEICDGPLNGLACSSIFAGVNGGSLSCKPDCSGYVVSACTPGRIVVARSGELTAVQAAVAQSVAGDIVEIPAGTFTWSATLTISKGIWVRGAGPMNGTTIVNGAGGTLVQIQPATDVPVRLSGLRFDQQNSEAQYVVVVAGQATHVRLDHLYFETGDWGLAWNPFLPSYGGITGPVNGVVDHCTFHNMKRAIASDDVRVTDRNHADGATAWTEPMRPGSIRNMYVEDCSFLYDAAFPGSAYTAGGDASIYANSAGGSIVLRHNEFAGYNANYLDNHGDMAGQDSARLFEVYHNTFTRGTAGPGGVFYVGNSRGGSWLVWGNVATGYGSSSETFRLWNYCAVNGHPVKDSYFWSNTVSPGPMTVSDNVHNSACPNATEPALNIDYFLHAPQAGQTFFPYVPLMYPHPLTEY